jgi:hypothetical protein
MDRWGWEGPQRLADISGLTASQSQRRNRGFTRILRRPSMRTGTASSRWQETFSSIMMAASNSTAKSSMTISMTTHPDQTPKVRAHALAHATFIISGDVVVPDFWTEYFGIPPDSTITKGKPFLYPSGKLSTRPGKLGLWAVKSESAVYSDHLTPHLRYLTDRLLLPRAGLRDLVCHDETKMSFWCYWHNETGDRVPDVPDDIRAMMEEMGGTIEIDEYR